jgi:integrase
MVAILKQALAFHGRKDLNEEIKVPAPSDRETRIKEQVLKDDQVKLLIEKAPTLRDRVLVSMFDELGNRRGEMWNLKIKDVQFDKYSAILTLTGKTGTRTRRVYTSVPDLRAWLNNHPYKDNPNAPLFLSRYNRGFTRPSGIYVVIANMSEKILGVRVRTHQFRHTKATRDSRLFTDREMMKLYGWSKPDVVSVYSHLSGKDIDDKDLVLHGLKTKEEILRPIMSIQKCPKCNEDNAPVAVFCHECGAVLGQPAQNTQEVESLRAEVQQLKGMFETVMKTKITKET